MNKMLQLASVARQEEEDGETMFKAFDLNGDGKVNLSEIKEVLVTYKLECIFVAPPSNLPFFQLDWRR
jgi:Ca2+-binding EF-hand superfamily protein